MFRKLDPISIIVGWIVGAVIFTYLAMLFLGMTTSGGEQKPETFLAGSIPVIVYGVLILSVATIPFFVKWMKSHWYFNLGFFLFSLSFILIDKREQARNRIIYSMKSETITVNGRDLRKEIQYYDLKARRVRSVHFYSGGLKDSTWITYDENGTVIAQENYRHDKQVK